MESSKWRARLHPLNVLNRVATRLVLHDSKLENDGRPKHELEPHVLKPRKRAITLPLPASSHETQKSHQQLQSVIFAKLPLEVRWLIWKECLGGLRLHLTIRNRRLGHEKCRSCHFRELSQIAYTGSGKVLPFELQSEWKLLSVILSCRRAYLEAIAALYAYNEFYTRNADCMLYLPRLLLQQRVNTIRTLKFDWRLRKPPWFAENAERKDLLYSDMIWLRIWENIASMKGLRELNVKVWVHQSWLDMSSGRWALEPIKAVTTPKVFELVLPRLNAAEMSHWESDALPCSEIFWSRQCVMSDFDLGGWAGRYCSCMSIVDEAM